MNLQPISEPTHLPSDIEPLKAANAFRSQREALKLVVQHDLPSVADKLYTKHIISRRTLTKAMNQVHEPIDRTVSLLSVVEDKIRAEPHVFAEFVKILESEPTLRSQAKELVKKYQYGLVPVPRTSVATSSSISRYGDYLERVYSRSSVSSDGKFPPTPSKTYVNLAVVKHASQIHDIEVVRENLLHGKVDSLLDRKARVELSDILKPYKDGSPVSLVFIEGPPGVGKSTLAWELCRKWDRKQYDLAVLLRLREREVQLIAKIADLFPHGDGQLQKLVTKEVLGREGKRVLFVLDGYDELPHSLRHQGLLLKLLKGEILPDCSVLVTSRPSSTTDLLTACSPQIQRHVEILGFTQECVKIYASSILSSEPEMLKDFLVYISASKNPAINSLMYIPLNAAIIVHIYRNSRREGSPIPKTLTQVYTQLCLTLLQRYLKSNYPHNITILEKFSDLPSTFYYKFKQLAQLAYHQFREHNVVFYSQNVPKELVHFGFLDSVSSLYGGCGVSYNFLHLTLQEFLAAYHITQFPSYICDFNKYSMDGRWEVVWRFVSGLTNFQYFMKSVRCGAFVSVSKYVEIRNLFLHCLFEGQFMFDYAVVLGRNEVFSCQRDSSSPLDRYALGYCIANCSSTTSWKVEIEGGTGESFLWGLNSNHSNNGVISCLNMTKIFPTCLDSYHSTILSGIEQLNIVDTGNSYDTNIALVQVLPQMKNLTSLKLSTVIPPTLLNVISQTSVTTLFLKLLLYNYADELSSQTFLFSLHGLINSPVKKLKDLTIKSMHIGGANVSTKPLCDVLFGPSSLNQLTLELPHFTESSFDLLKTNACLRTVHISSICNLSHQPLCRILLTNKTIEKLRWGCCKSMDLLAKQDETLNTALSSNTTLKELILDTCSSHSIIRDPRVSL